MAPRTLALTFWLSLVCACGGGGGGDGASPTAATTVSGTVAADAALAAYGVDVLVPSAGTTVQAFSGTTGSDGRYSVTSSSGVQPPLLVRAGRSVLDAEPQYQRLYSIALRGGTANVTPLTNLLVARLLDRKLTFGVDTQATFEIQNRSDADLAAARQEVVAYLLSRPSKDNADFTRAVDVSAVTDFVSMPLIAAPGDPHFEALRRLHDSLMDSETIEGVEEHMLFGNDPPADLRTIFDLDFFADCSVLPLGGGTLPPSGSTRVTLDPRGITFGEVHLPFESGTLLTLNAGQTEDNRWHLFFPTASATVDFDIGHGRLLRASLALPSGLSRCVAINQVSVSGKHPSLIALARLLAQSITNLRFQCADPITFAGFQIGPNSVIIQRNGALRINGLGGPSLHLPSLNITLNASLDMSTGQLSPIRATSFSASRFLRGGFDAFFVRLTDAGEVTGLSLDRKNEQSNRTQSCGVV